MLFVRGTGKSGPVFFIVKPKNGHTVSIFSKKE